MRVLVFTTQFYQLSGAEKLAIELAEDLNKYGIAADVLSIYSEAIPGVKQMKNELHSRGIPKVLFLEVGLHPTFFQVMRAVFQLRKLLNDEYYNVIETSMLAPSTIAAWATLCTGTKHIMGIHQVYESKRDWNIKNRLMVYSAKVNKKIRMYAISEYVKKCWIHFSGVHPSRIRTLYNSVPDEWFSVVPDRENVCQENGIEMSSKIIIYVGRLVEFKGIATILNSLGPVLTKYNLTIVYVGLPDPYIAGTVELIAAMKDKIRNKGWERRVIFLGYRKDVPRIVASADILVHPSKFEGFGLTVLEAMAAGIPVVTSDSEGIPEVVQGTDSIMIKPGEPNALREAVLKILNRTELERLMSKEKGKRRAEQFRCRHRTTEFIKMFNETFA